MTEANLDEYVKVTNAIDNIHDKINKYKKIVSETIENSSSEKEQIRCLLEFKNTIKRIKSDSNITHKYKLLKKRQNELKNILLSSTKTNTFYNNLNDNEHIFTTSDISNYLNDLQTKYSYLVKKKIIIVDESELKYINYRTKCDANFVKFKTIIDDVQKKLINKELDRKYLLM